MQGEFHLPQWWTTGNIREWGVSPVLHLSSEPPYTWTTLGHTSFLQKETFKGPPFLYRM